MRSAGRAGLVWWRRCATVPMPNPVLVGAPVVDGPADVAPLDGTQRGRADGRRRFSGRGGRTGCGRGATVTASVTCTGRPRCGPATSSCTTGSDPWPTDGRSGLAPVGPTPITKRVWCGGALEEGLHSGSTVWVALDDGEPTPIRSSDDALRWKALADLGPVDGPEAPPGAPPVEPTSRSTRRARWWAAAATLVSLIMLAGVTDGGSVAVALVVAGVLAGAVATARPLETGEPVSAFIRGLTALTALVAVASIAVSSGDVTGLFGFLSGPLPQILLALVVLHGFECRDRRSVRFSLAISAVIAMYASALRVDDRLVWWLAAWSVAFVASVVSVGRSPDVAGATAARPERAARRVVGWSVATAVTAAVGLAILAVVPVPRGPAVPSLPSFIDGESEAPVAGAIVDADGQVRDDGAEESSGERAPSSSPSGYVGFSETMDTAVRGDLGDDVVMRVRAPEPAFWRGQTFSEVRRSTVVRG